MQEKTLKKQVAKTNELFEDIKKLAEQLAEDADGNEIQPWDIPPAEDCDAKSGREYIKRLEWIKKQLEKSIKKLPW